MTGVPEGAAAGVVPRIPRQGVAEGTAAGGVPRIPRQGVPDTHL